jgi:hypothetical protein
VRTRRQWLTATAGAVTLLAGCGGADEPAAGSLGVTAADATAAPGGDADVEVTARRVGTLTFRIGDIPENWQVTHEGFDPEPTAVMESYPPGLVWDPAVESTSGSLRVAVAEDAGAGEYELPVEARAADGEANAVSTATITVEG